MRRRHCIVGVGQTPYGKLPGLSQTDLCVSAIRMALDDAGLDRSELDGVLTKAPTSNFPMLFAPRVAAALRLTPAVVGTLDQAGASNVGLIQYAMSCIERRQAEVIAIVYGDNPRSGAHHAYGRSRPPASEAALAGVFGAPSCYAMVARRYMHEYGVTHADLGAVAVTHRRHAMLNSAAERRDPITLDDYFASPWISDPFRALDCCPVSDGAAAFIVTSADRARHLRKPPVYIEGIGQGHPSCDFQHRRSMTVTGAATSGYMALRAAGVGHDEVDFCQLYDCFTIVPIITLEEYGFVNRGKAGAFYAEGCADLGAELPCNTSGGLLSETGLPGTHLCVEAVRQLRHECGSGR